MRLQLKGLLKIRIAKPGRPGWIKLQTAATDDDLKGIYLREGQRWAMVAVDIYQGEISAIVDGFSSGTASITEY